MTGGSGLAYLAGMRSAILLLALGLMACASTTEPPIDEDVCVPDPEPPHYGCDTMPPPPPDTLLPLPDSLP